MAKRKLKKKASQNKRKSPVRKIRKPARASVKKSKKSMRPAKARKALSANQELIIEQAKFSHPRLSSAQPAPDRELPRQYDCDRIVLQVRDPWWIFAYWEVRAETLQRLKSELKEEFHKAKRILRVYDVSDIIFNGDNAHRFFDVHVHEGADSWYIDTGVPGRSWCVDFGLLLSDGRFIIIARSNVVRTPISGPSEVSDEEWMIPEENFRRLYGLSFGVSSPRGKAWRIHMASSPGVSSMSSPVKKNSGRNA